MILLTQQDEDYHLLTTKESTQKAVAGLILNYIAVFLALAVVHGSFNFRMNVATYLFFAAIALDIIGIVILWTLNQSSVHDSDEARAAIYSSIAVPQTWSLAFFFMEFYVLVLLILAGSVWHDRPDAALLAAALLGFFGFWYLYWGFELKNFTEIQGESSNFSIKSHS